jgi:uncharacterized membrane protein YjgN (DUF898 family)
METPKPLEFKGAPADYFLLTIVTVVFMYVPIFGWAFILNYSAAWIADKTVVNGKQVAYKADYLESLKFVFINALLLFLTFGIYSFWFVPKLYRYVTERIHYVDGASEQPYPLRANAQAPTNPIGS